MSLTSYRTAPSRRGVLSLLSAGCKAVFADFFKIVTLISKSHFQTGLQPNGQGLTLIIGTRFETVVQPMPFKT